MVSVIVAPLLVQTSGALGWVIAAAGLGLAAFVLARKQSLAA